MKKTDFIYSASDSKPIHASKWEPGKDIKVRGIIQFIHGMAEHRHRYDDCAAYFTGAGFLCYAEDHRGHGDTIEKASERGFFAYKNGWNLVAEDIRILSDRITSENEGLPLIILGHSMGTVLARTNMIQDPGKLKMVVLSGTAAVKPNILLAGKIASRVEILRKGAGAESPLLDRLSFGSFNSCFKPNRTTADWLSRDESEVDKCIADPLVGFICTAGFFRDMLGGMNYVNNASNAKKIPAGLPVFLLSGENDPVGNMGKGVKLVYKSLKKAGIQDVEMKLYPGARHEPLHELNRAEVFGDILSWIEARL